MANNIYNLLNKPVLNPNKNGFDLGSFFPFSLKLGQIKPMAYFHTVPQGKYRISVDELCHTEPFITDPFVRLSKHIEVVFIPYSQLWHGASQFFGHSQDPQSSYELGHNYVPNFSLGNMLERIWNLGESTKDMQNLAIKETALSLLDMLGYGAHPLAKMDDTQRNVYIKFLKTKYVNAWALLAYNKYWNVYLRDTQHTSPLAASIFNADKVPCDTVETSHMDNYYTDDELLQLVTIKYRKRKKDLFTSALTSRQFGAVEGVQINFSGLNGSVSGNGQSIGFTYANGDLQTTYTQDIYKGLDVPEGYSPLGGAPAMSTNADGSLTLKASFTNGQSNITRNLEHNHAWQPNNINVNSNTGVISGLSVSGLSGSGGFDVYTLLTAQLMQKWREQIQRAGNRTEDRLRAVYGVAPASDAKNSPFIVGSTTYDLNANQVTSTSANDSVRLGDIAAKGIGYAQRNNFEFSASEFGIILVCTYILPENNYLAPIDKLSTLIEPFDYFTQQLENLGLEDIPTFFRKTVTYDPASGKYKFFFTDTSEGCAARYWAYKQKLNVVHLGFEHGQENSKWIPSRPDYDPSVSEGYAGINEYYVSPNEYDTVFGTVTDWHLDTDQFIGACRVNCDAVLPMSELGLPRW